MIELNQHEVELVSGGEDGWVTYDSVANFSSPEASDPTLDPAAASVGIYVHKIS